MFKVGDRVYAESLNSIGRLIDKGIATILEVYVDHYKIRFDGKEYTSTIGNSKLTDYKLDVIRKLTKLEQALQ